MNFSLARGGGGGGRGGGCRLYICYWYGTARVIFTVNQKSFKQCKAISNANSKSGKTLSDTKNSDGAKSPMVPSDERHLKHGPHRYIPAFVSII